MRSSHSSVARTLTSKLCSLVVFAATAGTNDSSAHTAGLTTFLVGGLAGAIALSVGFIVEMLSHGPMLVRTDMGVPMRIARGIVGTF